MLQKIARVIITRRCQRNCSGCCNTYSHIMQNAVSIDNISALKGYSIICITGGEPLLEPDLTLGVVAKIRRQNPNSLVYLYSALYTERMYDVVDAVDGIHYSLHKEACAADMYDFQQFQKLVAWKGYGKSFRLYIDPKVRYPVKIRPWLWKRVEIKPWLTEEELIAIQPNGLPKGETLFILENKESQ